MPVVPTMEQAHDVRAIATELIREHHTHLAGAQILYVFTDQRRKRCDRVRLGSAAKLTSIQRFLASGLDSVEDGPNFVMLIDSNEWAELERIQRHALVDHELCHMAVFVKGEDPDHPGYKGWFRWQSGMPHHETYQDWKYGMRGHDIEEFGEVLYRHGFWKRDGQEQQVKAIALQLAMPVKNEEARV